VQSIVDFFSALFSPCGPSTIHDNDFFRKLFSPGSNAWSIYAMASTNLRAFRNTSRNIFSVSLPVLVFCKDG